MARPRGELAAALGMPVVDPAETVQTHKGKD
jgi:hypothetical protein